MYEVLRIAINSNVQAVMSRRTIKIHLVGVFVNQRLVCLSVGIEFVLPVNTCRNSEGVQYEIIVKYSY